MKLRYFILSLGLATVAAVAGTSAPAQAAIPAAATQADTNPASSPAAATEAITSLAITGQLDHQGQLTISEQINYDFAGNAPHNITFSLPTSYHDDQGQNYPVTFSLIQASQAGASIKLNPIISSSSVELTLPRPTPTTANTAAPATPTQYQLQYRISPIVVKGPTADVLNYNATGLAWSVPITQATVSLQTPGRVPTTFNCSTGTGPVTTASCTIATTGDTTVTTLTAPLPAGAVLGLGASFPSGSFLHYLQPDQSKSIGLNPVLWLVAAVLAVIGLVAIFTVVHYRRKSAILEPNEASTTHH